MTVEVHIARHALRLHMKFYIRNPHAHKTGPFFTNPVQHYEV